MVHDVCVVFCMLTDNQKKERFGLCLVTESHWKQIGAALQLNLKPTEITWSTFVATHVHLGSRIM